MKVMPSPSGCLQQGDGAKVCEHAYEPAAREAVYRAIAERRDMRHFRPDPVDAAVLQRLMWAAHHAPSVGYMQPWRFIRISDRTLRARIHALVEEERVLTARALGEREEAFMKPKVEGVLDAQVMAENCWPGEPA